MTIAELKRLNQIAQSKKLAYLLACPSYKEATGWVHWLDYIRGNKN